MNKKNITLIVIAIVTLLSFVVLATYAYFTGTVNVNNKANLTASTERNNMVFDTVGGAMMLNVTATNMQKSQVGLAAQNSTTLTVNFQANTSYSMVCTYDIIYEWTSNAQNRYTTHTSGVTTNEFTIQATLASNSHVKEGTNSIKTETDLSTAVGNQASAVVVSGAQIDGSGTTTSTAVWTITSKFYNVNANQSSLANKSYAGRFKVTNVSCVAGSSNMILVDNSLLSYPINGVDISVNTSGLDFSSDNHGSTLYSDSSTLNIEYTPNDVGNSVCTYDIVYEWTSDDRHTVRSYTPYPGCNSCRYSDLDFSIQAILTDNSHVLEGENSIRIGVDLADVVGSQNSVTVVKGAQIDGTESLTSSAEWTIVYKIYRTSSDQSSLANKLFSGRFIVDNVSCESGKVGELHPTEYWFDSPSITYASGQATGNSVYIGVNGDENYACGSYSGKEVCLSQPYKKYGLGTYNGIDMDNTYYYTPAISALQKVFDRAGITGYTCTHDLTYICCSVTNLSICIESTGVVRTIKNSRYSNTTSDNCYVYSDGSAECYED